MKTPTALLEYLCILLEYMLFTVFGHTPRRIILVRYHSEGANPLGRPRFSLSATYAYTFTFVTTSFITSETVHVTIKE